MTRVDDVDGTLEERLLEAARLSAVARTVPSVVHQMSTPLAAIALRAEGLERAAGNPALATPEKLLRYAKAMLDDVQRCKDLLVAIRGFAGNVERVRGDVSLSKLCDAAVLLSRDEITQRQVQVVLDLDPVLPSVSGYSRRIGQLVLALLANALAATERGGRVTLATRPCEQGVELVVEDQGPGLDGNGLAGRSPFHSTRSPQDGLGLGLVACQLVAREHGGTLECHSPAEGHGARFVLRIPTGPVGGSGERS